MINVRRVAPAVLVVAVALLSGCGSGGDDPDEGATTDVVKTTYTLTCSSPVGSVSAPFEVDVSYEPDLLRTGDIVTYDLGVADVEAPDAPVPVRFVSSEVWYPLPSGMTVEDAALEPADAAGFSAASASVTPDGIRVLVEGDFDVEDAPPTPSLVVTGTVTAESGDLVEWRTPTTLTTVVDAAVVGTVESDCEVEMPGVFEATAVG